jgi:hypothetical protein
VESPVPRRFKKEVKERARRKTDSRTTAVIAIAIAINGFGLVSPILLGTPS